MNTKREIIGAAALAIVAVLLVLWYMNEHPAPFVNQSPSRATTTPQAATGPQSITDTGARYSTTAEYPRSTPLQVGNAEAIASMRQFELDAIAEFKQEANQEPDMGIGEAGVAQPKNTLDIRYTSATSPHTVSYIFSQVADTHGAHPNTTFRTFTFDLRTGKSLALADIFVPGADYASTLSQLSRELLPSQIAKNLGTSAADVDSTMLANGTTPETTNFQKWYFEGSNLVIVFEPYQVAAYAAGTQRLSIPLSRLTSLKPEYR